MNNKFFNTGPLPGSFVLLALAFALLHPLRMPASAAASATTVLEGRGFATTSEKESAALFSPGGGVPYA